MKRHPLSSTTALMKALFFLKHSWFAAALTLQTGAMAGTNDALTLTPDTPWVVAPNQPEAVQRALADVERDWYKVMGHRPVVLQAEPETWKGPLIRFGVSGKADTPEKFSLVIRDHALEATGVDTRGAIYAAYEFSHAILGVDPWYYWTDHEPTRQQKITVPANFHEDFKSPTFRYRGWFINDEDLLHGFSPDPLRENPYSLEMLDRICETILRLRGNMIVPGTFNFPDERCWELASRRGLVLNMHHILVVGLNTHRWPADVPFSHTKHPEIMEKYWRDCIQAFKGREVVWSVGYRGKGDQPFWTDERELKTPEERGAVITKAMAKQAELVREMDPIATMIANLWMEGSDMMRAGHLKLPEGTIQVWADNGFGRIRDEGTVKAGQGVYYHTAMLNGGANQLSEMVPPSRISRELGRFVRAGATNFLLVNVSDIRPVPMTTDFVMRFAWDASPFLKKSDQQNMDDFLIDWCKRELGASVATDAASIYTRYFNIPYQTGDDWYTCHGENFLIWRMRNMMIKKSNDLARSGEELAKTHRPYLVELLKSAEALMDRIPQNRQAFYESHVLTPIRIHLHLLGILEHYANAMIHRDASQAELAVQEFDKLFDAMHRVETGKWAAWYIGECLAGVEENRDYVRQLLAELRGEPAPPVRKKIGYMDIYNYQDPFLKNFPLLHPKTGTPKP